jgi:hypothetical protein
LFGDMDVDRRGGIQGPEVCQHFAHGFGAYRAERVQGNAQAQIGVFCVRPVQAIEYLGKARRVVDESALFGGERRAVEAALRVHDRQVGEEYSRLFRRREDALRSFGDRVVGVAPRVVVQVMEFRDAGVSRLEHLHVELGGDRLDVLRC